MIHNEISAEPTKLKKWETPDFYIIDTNPNGGHNPGVHEINYLSSMPAGTFFIANKKASHGGGNAVIAHKLSFYHS
jgi:hypothetical protein